MDTAALEPKSLHLPLPCTAPRASTESREQPARSRLETVRIALLVLACAFMLAWLLAWLFSVDGRLFELHFSVAVSGRAGMNFDMDLHNKAANGPPGRAISGAPRAAWNAARAYWSGVNHGVHSA